MKNKVIVLATLLAVFGCSEELKDVKVLDSVQNGSSVSEFQTAAELRQFADYKGRIRRIRLRERENGSIVASVDTEDATPAEVSYANIRFEEPFEGPEPGNHEIIASKPRRSGRGGKRFSWLEWNGTEMVGKSAVGFTYPVTATLHDKQGNVLGKSFSQKVLVEEFLTENEQPKISGFEIFSKDKGRTWSVKISVKDQGRWVEKVAVQFEGLKEKLSLERNGGQGNMEEYSASGIATGSLKADQQIIATVYFFGRGSRVTSSSASTKAELL